MKNFTFLFFLALMTIKGHGQCIGTYSLTTLASNNSGFEQQISAYAFTNGDFATITNLLVGEDYTFTCRLESIEKYITVTDADNVEIAHGPSPLSISAIANTSVKVHYSDDAACAGTPSSHIATIKIVLSCPAPTAAVVANLATTSADFAWEPGGSETAWEVIALPATSLAPATDLIEGVSVVNDNPEFTAVLLPATTYKFYYRAVCDAADKSPWNVSDNFTTLCEAVTYFSEGFDSSSTLPNCFAKLGSQGNAGVQSDANAPTSPNVLYMASGGILSLPAVSNYSAETHRIKFKVRSIYTVGGSVEFGYLLNPQDATSFVSLETFATNSLADYTDYTFEPDAATETGYFAFRLAAGSNSVILDDVIWEPIPACADVTLFKVDEYTSTAATLSWASEDTSWEVVYGVAATTMDPNALTAAVVEEASIALAALLPNTAYKVWVRSNCGDGAYGAWIGPKIITTTCAPVTTFSENFDASSSIPACFKKVGTGGNAYIQSSSFYISSYLNESTMSYGALSLPAISNAAAGTHRLKFTIKASGSVGGIIELGYLTNPDDLATFTAVQDFTSTSTTAQTVIYVPTAGVITAEVLAFRHTGTPSNTVVIDDLVWEINPACGDVMAIQANEISNASAKILWTGNSETNWEVAYGATTITDPNTLTPVAVSDVSNTVLSDLDAATTYKVWVRSNCGVSGFGAWIGPIQFITSCDPVTAFAEDFDASTSLPACWSKAGTGTLFIQTGSASLNTTNCIYISSYGTSFGILAAPPLSNASAGTHRLKFKAKASYGLGGVVEVGYLTSYNDGSTFVSLQAFTPTSTTVYDEFYANLGSLPTTGYVAMRHSGTSFNAVLLDDIVWEALPACEEVGGLFVGAYTNNTATMSWEATYSTAWEIVYTEVADETAPSALTPSLSDAATFTFTELAPDTVYKSWVRSVCDNELYSAWVGPLEFKTTCDPIADLPWTEDFESAELPNLPECWTKGNGNWELTDAVSFSNPYNGTQYIRVYNNVVNGYMWTPGFELEANESYDFSTFVQGDGYDGWSVTMVSNTTPKSEGAVQLGDVYNVAAGTGIQPYEQMTRAFVPTVSGTYFFAVQVNENSTAAPYYLAFDDFALEGSDLGNPEFGTNVFTVYPNPVKDILNLSYTENITEVAVFNLLGQQVVVKTINANKGQIDMAGLAAGSYLVKITADNQVKTIKIVKQ